MTASMGKLVVDISQRLFGQAGAVLFGITVMLACLTTAIGLTGSTSTFFNTLSKGKIPYNVLVIIVALFSTVISIQGLGTIIKMAVPVLVIVYPGVLVVVILTLFNQQIKNDNVVRLATAGAMLVATFEVIYGYIKTDAGESFCAFVTKLPMADLGFAWIIPAIVFGLLGMAIPCKNPVK